MASSSLREKKHKIITWGFIIFLLIIMVAPMALLYGGTVIDLFRVNGVSFPKIKFPLLFNSILLTLRAVILSAFMGYMAALFLWTKKGRTRRNLFLFLLISALIPHFIHVHSWIKCMDFLYLHINNIFNTSLGFTGTGAVIWTTALTYLPYTASLSTLALYNIPGETLDLMRIEKSFGKSFVSIILPYTLPSVIVGMIFVFLVTINDFAIPAAFGVNVFALEIFSAFSAGGNVYEIALMALPLVFFSLIFLMGFQKFAASEDFVENIQEGKNPFYDNGLMKVMVGLGRAILLIFISVPFIVMVIQGIKSQRLFSELYESGSQITYSFFISFLTGLVTVFFSVSYVFFRRKIKGRRIIDLLLAIPFFIPSSILGLVMISFWNNKFLGSVYRSSFMPVIGLTSRFFIISVLYLSHRIGRLDSEILDAASLDAGTASRFFKIVVPVISKDLVASFLLVFALTMGEYGVVLLVTPPGYQMITVKIYNYIHYGDQEIVYALNLTIFLVLLAVSGIISFLYRGEGEARTRGAGGKDKRSRR